MTPGQTALNRLAKWRAIFAGWQTGTRPKGDPQGDAIRDHREVTMILRAEVSALITLLIDKGVFSYEEFDTQLTVEVEHIERFYEEKFPGARAADDGMHIDLTIAEAWMSKFPP